MPASRINRRSLVQRTALGASALALSAPAAPGRSALAQDTVELEFWSPANGPSENEIITRLVDAWDPERMDVLMLLALGATSVGYEGRGDFAMDPEGRLCRRAEREIAPFVYAGVAIVKPEMLRDTPDGPFSLNLLFDRCIAAGRLRGLVLEGRWLHVGTPGAIAPAEAAFAAAQALHA